MGPYVVARAQIGVESDLVPTDCVVCGASDESLLFMVSSMRIVRCRRCGHRYVSPQPSRDNIREIYGDHYFENPAFRTGDNERYYGYHDYFGEREHIERLKSRVLGRIQQHVGKGRLLDVGCGPGFFVDLAARHGWDAWGLDINELAVRWAHDEGNTRVQLGTAEDAPSSEPFDCITMFDVIEHLENPRIDLSQLWSLLNPGGVLVVVTPNADCVVGHVLGRHWMEVRRAPEHLHFFGVKGLTGLLDGSGFSAFEWHSIGKIATVHNMMADFKFYAPRLMNAADRTLEELGWGQLVFDVDPRTKMCMYARRNDSVPRISTGSLARSKPRRISRHEFRRSAIASDDSGTIDEFSESQRRYWEGRERFRDPRLPGPSAFAQPKLDWITRHVPLTKATSVLDVGAGNGTVTYHLLARAGFVAGLDFSRNLLERAPCAASMVQGDAMALPFADGLFDVVFESNFLHHVSDPVSVLREMARVSRRHLVLIEPNRFHVPMTAFMVLSKPDWRGLRFDRSHVKRLARDAGLRVVAAEPQGAVYPNATPRRLLGTLERFDRPGQFRAYVVAVLEKEPGP